MTKIKNKLSKMLSTAILIILMTSTLMAFNQPVKAAAADVQTAGPLPSGVTANITIQTHAYLSVTPNPIGKNQDLLVNMWLHPPIHVARQFVGAFEVTFQKPDGTTEKKTGINSFAGDSTAFLDYFPDQTGTWQVKFDFIGQYFPPLTTAASMFASGGLMLSAYYQPSTSGWYNFTVQEDQVMSWPPAPLPTDYWTRPVSPDNREWWPVLGNFPPTGIVGGGPTWPADTNTYMSNYNFIPYVQAPSSAHIVWSQPFAIGGLIGGTAGQVSLTVGGMTGAGYPTIIYSGRCYEQYQKPGTTANTATVNNTYWKCYDLRTGQLYWDMPALQWGPTNAAVTPAFVEYHHQGYEVAGATARAGYNIYLTTITSPNSQYNVPGRILKWDPYTGALSLNLTGPPVGMTAGTLYAYPYVLSIQTIGSGATAQYRLINWTIENNAGQWAASGGGAVATVDNFTARICGNSSWPISSLGTVQDFESMISVYVGSMSANATGTAVAQILTGINLVTGKMIWNVTTDPSSGLETFFTSGDAVADHGKFACRMQDGAIWAWNLNNGQMAWKTELPKPWGVFGAYHVQSAYGLYYTADYDGIHALNWTNGNIEWTFKAPAVPFETPYNQSYSWHSSAKVADGKYYTFACEHTPSQPLTRGWKLYCLNATTGANIWNVTVGQGIAGSRTFQGGIADGYLAMTDEYEGIMNVYGKGQSSITITAPDVGVALNQNIVIKGTVLDKSPAQPGTPCISDNDMGNWMDYLHHQQPKPTSAIGVPVSIDAYDPNGNFVHIGDTTSDNTGAYGLVWKPQTAGNIAGQYSLIATFKGTNSYGSSSASTTVDVIDAPAASATTTTTSNAEVSQAPLDLYIIASTIAIIIAIAIVGLMLLRKR